MILLLTIRLESRAPCQKKVKRRLRTKALRWRKRNHAWWRGTRGVKKTVHKVLDLWSIQENTDERKEIEVAAGKSMREDQHQTHSDEGKHSNSNSTRRILASTPELRNMEYTNYQCMSQIFQFQQGRLGMSSSDAAFSMQAYKTNVLIW